MKIPLTHDSDYEEALKRSLLFVSDIIKDIVENMFSSILFTR